MTKRQTSKKSDEFKQYLGEKVIVYFKSPLLIAQDESGNPAMLPFVEGYMIDCTDTFVRMGDEPDQFTLSIDINEIIMIKLDEQDEIKEILKHLNSTNGDAH